MQTNAEKFQLVRKGFDQLGFASDELDAIYSIMAAVIHVGDVELVPAGPGEDNTDRCKIANPDQVKIGNGNCHLNVAKSIRFPLYSC